jgi:hypothetical protein
MFITYAVVAPSAAMENPIPHMKPFSISLKLDIYVLYLCNVCLTGWLQPVLNKERLRIASPVFKLLLCRCDEPATPASSATTKESRRNRLA